LVKKLLNIIKYITLTVIQNQKAWLFIIVTLFASSYTVPNAAWEIIAGLLSIWAMILINMNK